MRVWLRVWTHGLSEWWSQLVRVHALPQAQQNGQWPLLQCSSDTPSSKPWLDWCAIICLEGRAVAAKSASWCRG